MRRNVIEKSYLFKLKNGEFFDAATFRKAWTLAMKRAGLEYRKPYITRHSLVAWSLTIGIDKNRLVSLMGHGSKKMIYEVYGKYVDGLEKDSGQILSYFGRNCISLQG